MSKTIKDPCPVCKTEEVMLECHICGAELCLKCARDELCSFAMCPDCQKEDPLAIWESDGFRVIMRPTGRYDRYGKTGTAYKFFHEGNLIFRGEEYYPAPSTKWDSEASQLSLLSFFAMGYEDTDDEFFEEYTPEQIAWRDEFAEELSMIVMEQEEELEEA